MNRKNIITNGNAKLGSNIGNINMPKGLTCRPDAPCKRGCYCNHGKMGLKAVVQSHFEKLQRFNEDPKGFFEQLYYELQLVPYKYVRYHSSGDIVNEQYLEGMFWLARRCPNTYFLCFTKKYEMVNNYLDHHRKPKNLVITLSNWGDWLADNPHNLPTSWVRFGQESDSLIPKNAMECNGFCGDCVFTNSHCWRMQKGDSVVFKKH